MKALESLVQSFVEKHPNEAAQAVEKWDAGEL
jgi:hypothetical protein